VHRGERTVSTENSVSVVGASFAVLWFQLAAGEMWNRVRNVHNTTHRSWFVTCEGGRIVERPPLLMKGNAGGGLRLGSD
jgi:hypothetical protein